MKSLVQPLLVVVAAILTLYYIGKFPVIFRKVSEVVHGVPGCAPAAPLGNITLHYFDIRGRAEAIRLILEETGVPYKEVNFNEHTWPEYKKAGTKAGLYMFGQVPAMITSFGLMMSQSQAILHHIGRATGLECDCEEMHFCEMVAQGVEDVTRMYSSMVYNPEYSTRDRDEYLSSTLPLWLGYFERIAPPLSKQKNAFFSSERLTWVDILVFDLLDYNAEFSNYHLPSSKGLYILEKFPRLYNFYRQIKARPRINAYQASSKRFAYKLDYVPKEAAY